MLYKKYKQILCLDLDPIHKISHYVNADIPKFFKDLKSKNSLVPSISRQETLNLNTDKHKHTHTHSEYSHPWNVNLSFIFLPFIFCVTF